MSRILTTTEYHDPRQHAFLPQAGSGWLLVLVVGLIGLGGLLLRTAPSEKGPPPTAKQESSVTAPVRQPAHPSATPQRSVGPGASQVTLGRPVVNSGVEVPWPAYRGLESAPRSFPRSVPLSRPWELDELLARLQNTKQLTPQGAEDVKGLLRDLRQLGAAAVPAIGDLLRSGFDVDFSRLSGGQQLEEATLRQAMIESLRQIGGEGAIAALLEQLRTTLSPEEIAILARDLEEVAPGRYRDQAVRAANNALQALASTKDSLELRPLFETLRVLGGMDVVSIVRQFPANANRVDYLSNQNVTRITPTVQTYALITLAGLPDGEGIAGLAALAADPDVPVQFRTAPPFQMLGQAAASQPQAGETLVGLAQAHEIPDTAWGALADALAGRYLQFPADSSGSPSTPQNEANGGGAEAPFSRGFYDDDHNLLYEERLVAPTWSDEQVRRQRLLIDNLLKVTTSPTAVRQLERARAALPNRGL